MCAKMPILIESVGTQGQRVEQGFEWPDDSALKRVEKEGGGRLEYRHGRCRHIETYMIVVVTSLRGT